MKQFQLSVIYVVVFLLMVTGATAQEGQLNKYGLRVIGSVEEYQKSISDDPSKALTDLKKSVPGLVVDLRYGGANNFMQHRLYPAGARAWLRKSAADSLAVIQKELKEKGAGLKIFDAYRPWSITDMMWEKVKDDRYAADPRKGSNHNRGVAVDLTIIDLKTGKEWEMGTGFDNFSDTAHHAFAQLPVDVLQHRIFLKTMMEKHGFKALDTEWWHYSLKNAGDFELLDLGFDELKKLK